MKILYAIQGTGNGHISRAKEIIPLLQQYGELHILMSGTQADIPLPQKLDFRFHGFSYVFGKKGGIDYWKTFKQMNLRQLWKDIKAIPLDNYDIIINDFEPITAWACKLRKRKSVSLSHQASFLSDKTPQSKNRSFYGKCILKNYAPTTHHIGFHFKPYDDFIHYPVIRKDIRDLNPTNNGHYTVYLPSIDDKILVKYLRQLPHIKWEVFSKHQKISYKFYNVQVKAITNDAYNKSLESCEGLLTGGGFEGPAEALYLGKKVLMIPMKYQFEQECNAEAARLMGIPIIYNIDHNFVSSLQNWVNDDSKVTVNFSDDTAGIIKKLINDYG